MRYYGWFDCGKEGYIDVTNEDMAVVAGYFSCYCDHCVKKEWRDDVTLYGTDKQIIWAKKIRAEFMQYWQLRCFKEMKMILEKETNAKFWIETRDRLCKDDFIETYFLDPSSIEFQWRKLDQPQIIRAIGNHNDDFVLIENGQDEIWLYYNGKDISFSNVVKKVCYQLEKHTCAPCFRASKSITSSFYDEVLSISKTLLENGFNVVAKEASIYRRLRRRQRIALGKQQMQGNKKTTQFG